MRILSAKSIADMQVDRITKTARVAYSPAESGNFGYGFGEWVTGKAVSSPGLFGSVPWVNNEKKYCVFLLCYYLKSQGRHERYKALKQLVDEAVQ